MMNRAIFPVVSRHAAQIIRYPLKFMRSDPNLSTGLARKACCCGCGFVNLAH
jgi:hypothetical protein